jgi:hypothetical protein
MAQQPYQVQHYDERLHGPYPPVFMDSIPRGYTVVRVKRKCEEPVKKARLPVKRRKVRRSLGMPKRPLSAYNFFFGEVRRSGAFEGEREGTKKLGFKGLARTVAASWKSLDDDSRRPFDDMAEQEQIRYKKEYDEWRKSNRRYPSAPTKVPTKYEYGYQIEYTPRAAPLRSRSPAPVVSPCRITATTAHASRMGIPQHTNCYRPEPTYGYNNVPGTISVATEVTNDSHDSLDLPPHHYGSYTGTPAHSSIDYDSFYDNNTNSNSTQSPGYYGNVRNESTGPIHSTEQHGTYYSGPVHSPGAYNVARSSDRGPVHSSDYYGSAYANNYGPAQHMRSSVPPTVASRCNTNYSNPDYDAARRERLCSPSVPSLATMDGASLADMEEGEPYYDPSLWKRPSSPDVPSLATMDSKSLTHIEDESHSINTEESCGYPELGKADSFENMMDVLEKEDNSCDVWTWLKDI